MSITATKEVKFLPASGCLFVFKQRYSEGSYLILTNAGRRERRGQGKMGDGADPDPGMDSGFISHLKQGVFHRFLSVSSKVLRQSQRKALKEQKIDI